MTTDLTSIQIEEYKSNYYYPGWFEDVYQNRYVKQGKKDTKYQVWKDNVRFMKRNIEQRKSLNFLGMVELYEYALNSLYEYGRNNGFEHEIAPNQLPLFEQLSKTILSKLVENGYFANKDDLSNFIKRVFLKNYSVEKPTIAKVKKAAITAIFVQFYEKELSNSNTYTKEGFKSAIIDNIENGYIFTKTFKSNWRY